LLSFFNSLYIISTEKETEQHILLKVVLKRKQSDISYLKLIERWEVSSGDQKNTSKYKCGHITQMDFIYSQNNLNHITLVLYTAYTSKSIHKNKQLDVFKIQQQLHPIIFKKPWLNKQQYINKLNSVIILFQSTLIIILKQSLPTKITNKIPGMSSKLTSMLNR
jgi:hypothetical protein